MAQPKAQYFAKVLKSGNYKTSFYLLGWTPGTFDSHNVLFDIEGCRDNPQSSRGESNLGNYCNKKQDELTDKILVENDKAKRDQLIKEAFQMTTTITATSRCTSSRWPGACPRRSSSRSAPTTRCCCTGHEGLKRRRSSRTRPAASRTSARTCRHCP